MKLRLYLSTTIQREALRSLPVEQPWAFEMQVAFNHPEATRTIGMGTHVLVAGSPDTWEQMGAWCRLRSMTDTGVSKEALSFAAKFLRASDRIEKELLRLSNHPAYKGLAVAGTDPTVLPAWRSGDTLGPTVYFAMGEDAEKGWLVPERVEKCGRYFTRWTFTSVDPSPSDA